jgi:Phytanoyl-CoA dioxygenase (PhyH)
MIPSAASLRFSDPLHDAQFRQRGFVVVPLLSSDEVASLTRAWSGRDDATRAYPYAATLFSRDAGYRRAMSEIATATLAPRLASLIPEAALVYAGFASKAPREPASVIPFHQDPSFVDEQRWGAANIWVPLIDLDADNGPLFVVPCSHRFNRGRRGFNQVFAYHEHEEALRLLACPIHARAGEAIVFAHTLFHFSPPNRSAHPRPAAGGLIADLAAPLFYNFVDPADRGWIESYEADRALFLDAPIATRPSRAMSAREPVTVEPLALDELRSAVGFRERPREPPP